jgi:hypothetical protein
MLKRLVSRAVEQVAAEDSAPDPSQRSSKRASVSFHIASDIELESIEDKYRHHVDAVMKLQRFFRVRKCAFRSQAPKRSCVRKLFEVLPQARLSPLGSLRFYVHLKVTFRCVASFLFNLSRVTVFDG